MNLKNIELETLFKDTIQKLKNNERPKIVLTPELIEKIKLEWREVIADSKIDTTRLQKLLCILDNTHNLTTEFQELIIDTLSKVKDAETTIYTLAAAKKHVIEENLKNGVMIPQKMMDELKKLLTHPEPEVFEWVLRTVDDLGPLGLRLRDDILKNRPGIGAFFNKHKKNSLEIIDHLEKKFNEFKRK